MNFSSPQNKNISNPANSAEKDGSTIAIPDSKRVNGQKRKT